MTIVREPLDKLDRNHLALDEWELVLYIMAFSFLLEGNAAFVLLSRFSVSLCSVS